MSILFILIIIAALIFSFFCTAGIFWLICWAFGITFSWKIAFGFWLIACFLSSISKSTSNKN